MRVLLGKRFPPPYSGMVMEMAMGWEMARCLLLFVTMLVNIAVLGCDVWGGGSHLAALKRASSPRIRQSAEGRERGNDLDP